MSYLDGLVLALVVSVALAVTLTLVWYLRVYRPRKKQEREDRERIMQAALRNYRRGGEASS